MPRTASTVTFGEFSDAINTSDLAAFWKMGGNLNSDQKRRMREMVMGSNHTSIWNMVQDVENILKGGGNREAPVRMTGKLTVDGVSAALVKYVANGEPLPVPDGSPAAATGAAAPSPSGTNPSVPAPAPAASGSTPPPQGVAPNILEALNGLYADQSQTFETVATGDDFRMLLWGIAPENLRTDAEVRIISDALGTLTKSADAAAVVRSILTAAGIDDGGVLAAMRAVNPVLVTSQHGRAADSLFHLNLIAAQLKGYEGLVRDAAVAIVRKARQRGEATEDQVKEARLTVAVDTLGDLLDSLEREAKRWEEFESNRKAAKEREETAQSGNAAALEGLPYSEVPEGAREQMPEAVWNTIPRTGQEMLIQRFKDQLGIKEEAEAAPEGEAAAETSPETPETSPEGEAAPEPRRNRK